MKVEKNYKQFLSETVYRHKDIDLIVDSGKASWIRFDQYHGYLGNDIDLQDGQDQSTSIYSYEPTGERTKVHYADKPCRINTYGDSYTLCQQVSNGETWQEHLAAHLQEPVRNFGTGGQGVLHAFLRMKKAELKPETSGDLVVLNVFNDNHLRNLEPARRIRELCGTVIPESEPVKHVMGLPWTHLYYDLDQHGFVTKENPLKNPEDLFRFCEQGSFYDLAKDNVFIQLLAMWNKVEGVEVSGAEALAEEFGLSSLNFRDPSVQSDSAWALGLAYGIRSTQHILNEARAFTEAHGKKLLVVTSYSANVIIDATEKNTYDGRTFSEFLKGSDFHYYDTMPDYVTDFSNSKKPLMEYMYKYFVEPAGAAVWGHLNPAGNQSYAFYVKNAIIDMLNPKPAAYKHLEG